LNKLAVIYMKFGKPDEAVKLFNQALSEKADYQPALLNLGHYYFVNGIWTKPCKPTSGRPWLIRPIHRLFCRWPEPIWSSKITPTNRINTPIETG